MSRCCWARVGSLYLPTCPHHPGLAGRGQQRRRPSSRQAEAHTGPLSSGSCPLAPEDLAAWETGRAPSPMTQSVAGGAAPVPPPAPKSAEKQKELGGGRGLWTWGINKALVQSQPLPTGWGPQGEGLRKTRGLALGRQVRAQVGPARKCCQPTAQPQPHTDSPGGQDPRTQLGPSRGGLEALTAAGGGLGGWGSACVPMQGGLG